MRRTESILKDALSEPSMIYWVHKNQVEELDARAHLTTSIQELNEYVENKSFTLIVLKPESSYDKNSLVKVKSEIKSEIKEEEDSVIDVKPRLFKGKGKGKAKAVGRNV